MKITIITDNTVYKEQLRSEWGFAALVEVENTPKILFDTGASGDVLLHNMEKLDIDPKSIDCVFISHDHWDHTGGFNDFLKFNNNIKLYVPYSVTPSPLKTEVIQVKDSLEVYGNIFSTGKLQGIEQSMAVKTDKGVVVIVGCSHPGVGNILKSASAFGEPTALIGGLHGFNQFELVKDLDLICATHCTQHRDEIKQLYPVKFVEGGAGKVIEI